MRQCTRAAYTSHIPRYMWWCLFTHALRLHLQVCFALTTRTSDWFTERGFVEGPPEDLPREKLAEYDRSRQSKVLYRRIDRDGLAEINHGMAYT